MALWQRCGKPCNFVKVIAVIVLLLVILVIGGFPFAWMKSGSGSDKLWSHKAGYISKSSVERIINEELLVWAKEAVVIEAVKEANKKGPRTAEQISRIDKRWVKGELEKECLAPFLDSPCARFLREQQKGVEGHKNVYSEIFITDRQGCIVAATNKTTDFWQGDEDIFIKAYADSKGDIFIHQAKYDESVELPLIQVSVPVRDPNSQEAIGVMVVGLDVDILFDQM